MINYLFLFFMFFGSTRRERNSNQLSARTCPLANHNGKNRSVQQCGVKKIMSFLTEVQRIMARLRGETIPAKVREAWKPDGAPPVILLRWFATTWCNYSCAYCSQDHAWGSKIEGHFAHCFDNYPVDEWIGAFQRHFASNRLSLVITGGEPLLDYKRMAELVNYLTRMPTVECIRIDTNTSLEKRAYKAVDPRKITLMCSYHPAQTSEDEFFSRIDGILSMGFRIGMVNYVITKDSAPHFERRYRILAEKGVPLNPNAMWNSKGLYSEVNTCLLRAYMPRLDYSYRTQLCSPKGKPCFFPAVAYSMNQWGAIHVGCHPNLQGQFFETELPQLFSGSVPCPLNTCGCLDMYSFLAGQDRNQTPNPLATYHDVLMKLHRRRRRSARVKAYLASCHIRGYACRGSGRQDSEDQWVVGDSI